MAKENDDPGTRVVFKMHASHDPVESRKAGRPIYTEQEIVEISFAGNKSTVFCAPAHSKAGWGPVDPITGEREQITYAMKYNPQYLAFKSGDALSLHGTPLEELTFLTQSKRLELKALNIFTAEALAGLDGSNLKMLGMQGRELKNQATAYLENAEKSADAVHLADELARRDETIAKMQAQIESLVKGAAPASDEPKAETVTAFDTFDDEDIINWLKDADPTLDIDGRWSRKTLIAKAEAILEKQGKKKAA